MRAVGAVRGAERVLVNQRLCAVLKEMDFSFLSSILNYTTIFLQATFLYKDSVVFNAIITTTVH